MAHIMLCAMSRNTVKIGARNTSGHPITNSPYGRDSVQLLTLVRAIVQMPEQLQYRAPVWALLRKFVKNISWIDPEDVTKCENDVDLYKLFHSIYHENGLKRITLGGTDGSAGFAGIRAEQRCNEICEILDKFEISVEGGRYLDYGCSSGIISAVLGKRLGTDTHGCDVPMWHGIENKCIDRFVTYQHLVNGEFPSKMPGKFNLISALMVLHHIHPEKLLDTLRSLVDRVDDGGFLLVREHDVRNTQDVAYCHFEHALYDLVTSPEPFWSFYDEYVFNYQSVDYWDRAISALGIELIYSSKPRGLTRHTYMLFQKCKNIEPAAAP